MPTYRQLSIKGRGKKRRRCIVAALKGSPQRKGVVMKMGITTPRKPNSAKRKYAKVRVMASKKLISAHPPGIGPTYIQEYSLVLVEGGSPPDTPGINYSLIRGIYDFCVSEEYGRRRRRSKFGAKTPSIMFNAIKSLKDNVDLPENIIPVYYEREITESYLKKINALKSFKQKIRNNLIKNKKFKALRDFELKKHYNIQRKKKKKAHIKMSLIHQIMVYFKDQRRYKERKKKWRREVKLYMRELRKRHKNINDKFIKMRKIYNEKKNTK